jgi:hypothetical protein
MREQDMRYATFGLALAMAMAAASWAQACPAMKNAAYQEQVATNDQAPNTPAQIPLPKKSGS